MSRPLSDDRDTATTVCDVTHWEMFEYSKLNLNCKPSWKNFLKIIWNRVQFDSCYKQKLAMSHENGIMENSKVAQCDVLSLDIADICLWLMHFI